jgi:NTE family protein
MSELNVKSALVLSGGGAKGKYQVGAMKVLSEFYKYDYITGVSVGALNAAMLATSSTSELLKVWLSIKGNNSIYSRGLTAVNMVRIALFGQPYWYSNTPLVELMREHINLDNCHTPFSVGVVSLNTGQYLRYTYTPRGTLIVSNRDGIVHKMNGNKAKDSMFSAILASTAIPVVFPPVKNNNGQLYVDGGVRDVSPLSDAIHKQATFITIVNCSKHNPLPHDINEVELTGKFVIAKVAARSMEIAISEIIHTDIAGFLDKNHIISQVDKPIYSKSGRQYKYFESMLVEPSKSLGSTLDFSPESIESGIDIGAQDARSTIKLIASSAPEN